MVEIVATVYWSISLLAFFIAACTSENTYGRGVVQGVNWEMAFIAMVFWPIFLVVLVIVGIKILFEKEL